MSDTMRLVIALALSGLPLICQSQGINRSELAPILNFETEQTGGPPRGWGGGPPATIFTDDKVVHSGKWSVRLVREAASGSTFSTITIGIPVDFAGTTVELRGFLKTEDVAEFAGLWMREDGDSGSVAFDNMQNRQFKGTHDWTEHSITLPLRAEAKRLFFGVLSAGTGTTWADDLRLTVDGKPIWDAPKIEQPKTVLDLDHEFDRGSGVALDALSKTQIGNLTTLGRVWGFLKYHHQEVTAGKHHFDYDLLRLLPGVLAAPDRAAANAAMLHWIDSLGEVTPCTQCAAADPAAYFLPDLAWISDEVALGADLSRALKRIYDNRAARKQFYVALGPGAGNPLFQNEPNYAGIHLRDAGFQILALYRYWNIIEYWYPYRDLIGDKAWDAVLGEFLPRIALAADRDGYQREMLALAARVGDTHANLWGSLALRPPVGACQLPVDIRFVENRPVVARYLSVELGKATGLEPGDAIEQLDGVAVEEWIRRWTPYYAASNETTRLRDIGRSMTRGDCAKPLVLRIQRRGESLDVKTARIPVSPADARAFATHDRPGDAFQLLSPEVGYLKLSGVKAADARRYVDSAAKTKGLIIDIRNYPAEFVVFALGELLVDRSTEFARFTTGDLSNPGAFHWGPTVRLEPKEPHYGGRVVILTDEISMSQAEYTAMAFRSAREAIVIGSTTAAADGNVSPVPLPGDINTLITGIGVFYPDKRPTQRIGIIPDLEVKPTIAGIRDGRDEVLEAAVRTVLGASTPETAVRRIANGK